MTRQHAFRALGLTLAFLVLIPDMASAQMFVPTGRDTLRELPGVEVIVESLQPELEREGVSGSDIRDAMTRQLLAGGIPVYESQRENPSLAKAYLYLHLNALELPDQQGYAVAVLVQVRQTLQSVVTVSQIVDAMTWDAHNVLHVPPGNFDGLYAEIERYVTLFISDWVAVH